MPPVLEATERSFWVGLGLWGSGAATILATGLFLLFEGYPRGGAVLTAIGFVAAVLLCRQLKNRLMASRFAGENGSVARLVAIPLAIFLVLSLAALGYAIWN